MMHFFVRSTESPAITMADRATTLNYRLESLDYLTNLYNDGRIGFYFRNYEGNISYELHRVESIQELDARLKSNPQWAFANHDVVAVTKTGDMVRELTNYLNIDPDIFFREALSRYEARGILSSEVSRQIMSLNESSGKSFIEMMSADEEPIDEDGTYTVVQKASLPVAASISRDYLEDMWIRTLRSQVAHLNSSIEFIDYNPVGKSEGILIGKGDLSVLKSHIESTEIYPDTTVTYYPVRTPRQAGRSAAIALQSLKRDLPALRYLAI